MYALRTYFFGELELDHVTHWIRLTPLSVSFSSWVQDMFFKIKEILRPGKTHATFQRNNCQHCWIVLWDTVKKLAKRAQHPKMLQQKFDHFQNWPNTIQHVATCCNMLIHGGQTCATRCMQQCRMMLVWNFVCIDRVFSFDPWNNQISVMCKSKGTIKSLSHCKLFSNLHSIT